MTLGQKSSLVSRNQPGENVCIIHQPTLSNVYHNRIYIFDLKSKKKQQQQQKKEHKKQMKLKKKRISVENLMGDDDIVCEFTLCILTSLIVSLISPGCSYEFNVVYVQQKK